MNFYTKIKYFFITTFFIIVFLFFLLPETSANRLVSVSDRISTSAPNVNSNHTINFIVSTSIPPSGKIVITPESGFFNIPTDFDYNDIDLATSVSAEGPFVDRILALSPTVTADGIAVATSTAGNIIITLNSSYGIDIGDHVLIEIGNNATFGEDGVQQIVNPSIVDSYKIDIETYNASNAILDRAEAMIAIVSPVGVGVSAIKSRSNGQPTGILTAGTTQTLMSLITNYDATCRYSTATATPYTEMTGVFSNTGSRYHSTTIIGLTDGLHYYYHIKCEDEFFEVDTDDFMIIFSIASPGGAGGTAGGTGGGEGDGDGEGSSGGGGGGGGSGGGGGAGTGNLLPYPPEPLPPNVTLEGLAYPFSEITVLKDGAQEATGKASLNAKFSINLSTPKEGVYTFGLWAQDSADRKSITHTVTFWVQENTKTVVSDIIIPPTIELTKNSLDSGEILSVFGQSAPKSVVEAWLYPSKSGVVSEKEIIKKEMIASDAGKWNLFFTTTNLAEGLYKIKARSSVETMKYSGFSKILNVGIGEEAPSNVSTGADLNGDGKVNLTDFSILLYYWNTDNASVDQNKDGKINITDFSILLYYWTG